MLARPYAQRDQRAGDLISPGDRLGVGQAIRAAARERWRFYKERGYPLAGFDLAGAEGTA